MKPILIALLGSMLCIAVSCSKDNEEDVGNPNNPNNPNNPGGSNCDTADRKFAAHVLPILQANCFGCHGAATSSGSGGIVLEGYSNLKSRADNGRLIGTITHAQGFPAMPQGAAKLSDCNINVIRSWIENGAKNN